MASLAGGLPDRRHHPLPETANGHARRAGTPHFTRKSAIALARLHCLRRTQRSLRRSPSSRSLSVLLQAAWRKYVTHPVAKLITSLTIRSSAIPRLRRVIRRSRSLTRSRLFGARPSRPPGRRRWPRKERSITGATALFA